jgi:hypothetical protein
MQLLNFSCHPKRTFDGGWPGSKSTSSPKQNNKYLAHMPAALGHDCAGLPEVMPRERQTRAALVADQQADIEMWWPIIGAANIPGGSRFTLPPVIIRLPVIIRAGE